MVDADGFESAKELLLADDVESSFDINAQEVHVTTGRDVIRAALALLALVLFTIQMASHYCGKQPIGEAVAKRPLRRRRKGAEATGRSLRRRTPGSDDDVTYPPPPSIRSA